MSELLTARAAIEQLFALGFGPKVPIRTQISPAGNLMLKALTDGQATENGVTVIAHKVRREGLPEGCIGTVVEARYEIRVEGETGSESVDSLNRFGEPE